MSRYDLSLEELTALLPSEPAFRSRQLYDGLYKQLLDVDEIHVLPSTLRRRVCELSELAPALHPEREQLADEGRTRKWLYSMDDGHVVETVLMHYPRHTTVCVSSQAGCAMGCTFCATGDAGFSRQLTAGQILEQVVRAARASRNDGRRLDHVVFMGMGEPMANFPRVWQAAERMMGDLGLGARHLTISTVGIIPGIDSLAAKDAQVNLAVSLHAANDALRDELVPINRRYPIAELRSALTRYFDATNRRITFEWALIDGINDRPQDAAELAEIALAHRAHVNVIPMNPTVGGSARGLRGSPPDRIRAFREQLLARGVNVTVRQTRGRGIDAACGQLAGSTQVALRDRAND